MKIQFTILTWLTFWFYPNVGNRAAAINELLNKVNLWTESKGELWVINHLKEIRLLYTRHQCGDPVKLSPRIIGIRKDGLPKGFPILNQIYLENKQGFSFTLTLLSISRTIKAWKTPDLSTITKPYTGISDVLGYEERILKICEDYNIRPYSYEWTNDKHYYSIKAGPTGLATWSAPWDAIKNASKILPFIRTFSNDLGNQLELWSTYNESLKKVFIKAENKQDGLLRKLSIIKDPEGKSRIIAIFDYWSQTVLKVVHDKCFNLLNHFEQDRTFTQDPKVDFVGPYYSFDLSAATDRFPISFQMILVKHLLGEERASAWQSILIDNEFYAPFEDKFVKYEVGQPMGAYSSWAVFSLCHHIIVQIAAMEIGQYPTKNYILLGDDIVIGGTALANAYQRHIELLGVEISNHKTHTSINTYEFAKRWIKDGREVSGIQVSAFMQAYNNYALMYQTLRQYLDRGFIPSNFAPLSELIFHFNVLNGMPLRKAFNINNHVQKIHALVRWIHYDDMTPIRNLLANILPSEAPVPIDGSPHLIPYLSMRLESVLAGQHAKLLKAIDGIRNNFIKRIKNEYMPSWPENYGGVTPDSVNAEFHGDILGTVNGDLIGPGGIENLPVVHALRNLEYRLHNDVRLYRPETNFKEAINALCLPNIERIGSTRTEDSVKLLTTKIGREFIQSAILYMTDANLQYTEENFFNEDSMGRMTAAAIPAQTETLADQLGPDFDFSNFM